MAKVKQKVSGCFRTEIYAKAYFIETCRALANPTGPVTALILSANAYEGVEKLIDHPIKKIDCWLTIYCGIIHEKQGGEMGGHVLSKYGFRSCWF